jgi:hypothetical protein
MMDGIRLSSASDSMTRCMPGLRTVSFWRSYQGAVALLRFYLVTSSSLVLFHLFRLATSVAPQRSHAGPEIRDERLKPPSPGPRLKGHIEYPYELSSVLQSAQESKGCRYHCLTPLTDMIFQPVCSASSTQLVKLQVPVFGSTVNFSLSTNHSAYMRTAACMACM